MQLFYFYYTQGRKIHQPPQITQSYQPPDVCAIRSGDGDGNEENDSDGDENNDESGDENASGTVQLIYSTAAITFLALITMLF